MKIGEILEEHERGWTLFIDGEEVVPRHFRLVNERAGEVVYGMRPEGYDSWLFKENGGGGSVTMPFFRHEGVTYVGLILEDRANMGGKRWCAIGGFKNPGEVPKDAAQRELSEETGLNARPVDLNCLPQNFNRLFNIANADDDEGVHFHGLELSIEHFEVDDDSGSFRPRVSLGAVMNKGDRIDALRFFPALEVPAISPDMMASAGTMCLIRYLAEIERI